MLCHDSSSKKRAANFTSCLTAMLAACTLIGCMNDPGFRPTISSRRYNPSRSASSVKISQPAAQKGHLTVTLALYTQGDRVAAANALRARASSLLTDHEIWLNSVPTGLAVNYGRFDSSAQAEKAHQHVKAIYKQLNAGPLQFSFVKEIPQPDPSIPASWYLLNNSCFYTLEIGSYYDVPEKNYYNRKYDAAKAVKALRDDGEKAYLIHGQFESRIYVGCFGAQEVQRGYNAAGRPEYKFSAEVRRLQKKYPYRWEHGNRVYQYVNENGRRVRKAWRSAIVPIDLLMQGLNF